MVSEPSTPITIIDSISHVSCFNGMDGVANLYITGGVSPYIESWPNANPNQLLAGYNMFEILDANNCLYTDSVFINQPTPIVVAEQILDVLCNGASTGSASLLVSGGTPSYTYSWSSGTTSDSIGNLTSGVYIITVTDSLNCSSVDSVIVNEPTAINTNSIVQNIVCLGDSNGSITLITSETIL